MQESHIDDNYLLDPELDHTIEKKFEHCCEIINTKRKDQMFYIGITSDPKTRADDHIKNKNLSKMFLLCIAKNEDETKILERGLIKEFNSRYMLNDVNGGGGVQNSKNFIYLMV